MNSYQLQVEEGLLASDQRLREMESILDTYKAALGIS